MVHVYAAHDHVHNLFLRKAILVDYLSNELTAYSDYFRKQSHIFIHIWLVNLAYSGGEDEGLFHADDYCLMFNAVAMEKTPSISRNDSVDNNVYITCLCI